MAVDKNRAKTDPEYRKTLTREQLAELAASELTDDQLEGVVGGFKKILDGGDPVLDGIKIDEGTKPPPPPPTK